MGCCGQTKYVGKRKFFGAAVQALGTIGISQLAPTKNQEAKNKKVPADHNSGPCSGMNWAPTSYTTPSLSNMTDATVDVTQWILWNSTAMQNFKNLGSDARYQHEILRYSNVWNFIRLGFLGTYCFIEMATNLPNPTGWWSEESDWWAINCPNGFIPDDEEAQDNCTDSASLQANTWYYDTFRMERVSDQISLIQLSGENILFGPSKSGKLKVVSEPKIDSKANLDDYVKRAQQRWSVAVQKGGKIVAAVTAQKPLAFERIAELEKKHSLGIIFAKMRSSNGGTVFSQWPPDQQWLDGLQQNLAAELKERAGIDDFKLVTGVIALHAVGEVTDLEKLQSESDVYLVDVGPVDVAEQYRDGKDTVVKVTDVYYYLEKFS